MIEQADLFGLELDNLAQQLCARERHANSNLHINNLLFNARELCGLEQDEILHVLMANPLAILAAWELTSASDEIAALSRSESAYLAQFSANPTIEKMVYLGLNPLPDPDIEIPRAITTKRRNKWSGLVFIQDVARWANRFAHFEPFDIRDFSRINHQYPFAVAVVEEGLHGEERLIHEAIKGLGISLVWRDSKTANHHMQSWLENTLGRHSSGVPSTQTQLDFREAGGTMNSAFVVRAVGGVDGFDVRGTIGSDLGLIIDIGDKEISIASTAYIEKHVIKVINGFPQLSAELMNNSLRLRWYDNRLQAEDLGRIIHEALKREFILSTISVKLIFDSLRLNSIKHQIYSYIEERNKLLQQRVEENAPLAVCKECVSYFPHAFCISSADRPPCCGRSYDELATMAQFTRNPNQIMLDRGVCQNRQRGTYIGAQKAARMFSEDNVSEINLHSIRNNPHPTSAIPECVAYYREDLDVICIISKDFNGKSPDGKTFDSLLQRVAGVQSPGYVGICESYILSPRFFSSDGGFARIGWMNDALKSRLGIKAEHIATEKDCTNIGGLKDFLTAWRN